MSKLLDFLRLPPTEWLRTLAPTDSPPDDTHSESGVLGQRFLGTLELLHERATASMSGESTSIANPSAPP